LDGDEGAVAHEPYWSVDIPGMTRAQLQDLLAWLAEAHPSLHGIPADPKEVMTVHLDRDSVQVIRQALAGLSVSDAIAKGLIEVIDEWIAQANDD
jgi:hypothetical protein